MSNINILFSLDIFGIFGIFGTVLPNDKSTVGQHISFSGIIDYISL